MGRCETALAEHSGLAQRRRRSAEQLGTVAEAFQRSSFLRELPISVYCAGSLARREIGAKSDLDVFVTADESGGLRTRLCQYTLFAELIQLNKALDLPEFSNDGQYLKVYFVEELKKQTGSPQDDSDNLFTARMLLLLESEPLVHSGIHGRHLRAIIQHYYRDQHGKRSFRPLFLLNDLLRYWRTLCLNYEERRHDPTKPWRKKNVNLKFSRMITVFGTVLPLVLEPLSTTDEVFDLCRQPPLDRLSKALDRLDDESLQDEWPAVLDAYEQFLAWKEEENIETALADGDLKRHVAEKAALVSTFLYNALTHDRIRPEFRRYLVL